MFDELLPGRVVDAIAGPGWLVVEGAFDEAFIGALRADADAVRHAGGFRRAGVGRGDRTAIHDVIRGDSIAWFPENGASAAQLAWLAAMDGVRERLNRELYLGLASTEAHYAIYPPSSGYARHLDRFADSDERTISTVTYLNPDWHTDDGGALRIFTDDSFVDVLPRTGTVVFFRSDLVWHEVRPSHRERWSIAGWMRRRSLGDAV